MRYADATRAVGHDRVGLRADPAPCGDLGLRVQAGLPAAGVRPARLIDIRNHHQTPFKIFEKPFEAL